MTLLDRLAGIVGAPNLLTGDDTRPFASDWTGSYTGAPLAVARPGSTAEVAALMRVAAETRTPVVPVSGLTGLAGGAHAPGALMVSLARMNRLRSIRPEGRVAVVEAGMVLADLHRIAGDHGLIFPLTFGARGSAMIGGALSTNAGGSNVLRYGTARALCLGIEAVLPDGRVMDLLSPLHKDNTGLDLRDLMIGAEGQLGIITAAVVKLFPRPRAYATAMVALPSLDAALRLLNRMQEVTGGAVEAFEYMPREFIEGHLATIPGARPPFADIHDIHVMIEVGATAPRDADPLPDGSVPVVTLLEETLGAMLEAGEVIDAAVARTEAQRAEMWARREAAAEIVRHRLPQVDNDICLPLDRVGDFLARALPRLRGLDPGIAEFTVAHLGDGNLHYTVFPTRDEAPLADAIREAVEDLVAELGGSFSAEHGIGKSKLGTMRRRKDPVALDLMRRVKAAIDPLGIMNPGKVIPAAE